jgi:ADP-ribose pyrophosphatase
MIKPFTKISEEIVWQGRYRSMKRKIFRLPNGETNDYEVVSLAGSGVESAVVVLALNDRQEILTNLEFRVSAEKVMFDLPSGGVEPHENLAAAAQRELVEETGYAVQPRDLEFLGTAISDPYTEINWHFFLAQNLHFTGEQKLDAGEFIETKWIPLKDFIKYAREGQVCGSYGMAFLLAWDKLKDKEKK